MKATIYVKSEFMGDITKWEVTLREHGRRRYAQYDAAPYAIFIPKGKRKERICQQSYRPFMLIVAGWGHLDPDDMMGPVIPPTTPGGCSSRMSRYSSFDPRWQTDFNAKWARYATEEPGLKVIADYRERDEADEADERAEKEFDAAAPVPKGWDKVEI